VSLRFSRQVGQGEWFYFIAFRWRTAKNPWRD